LESERSLQKPAGWEKESGERKEATLLELKNQGGKVYGQQASLRPSEPKAKIKWKPASNSNR